MIRSVLLAGVDQAHFDFCQVQSVLNLAGGGLQDVIDIECGAHLSGDLTHQALAFGLHLGLFKKAGAIERKSQLFDDILQ